MKDSGRFAARAVKTGQETAQRIVILSGLKEGDLVVSSGAFLIESESRLQSALDEMESKP